MEKTSQNTDRKKISYVKPDILDLGPVTPIAGATDCTPSGNVVSGDCLAGTTPGGINCTGGIGVVP
jgi:hypothetical protein